MLIVFGIAQSDYVPEERHPNTRPSTQSTADSPTHAQDYDATIAMAMRRFVNRRAIQKTEVVER
jgi:hypothetical protein